MKKNLLIIMIVIVLIAASVITIFGFAKIFKKPEAPQQEVTEQTPEPNPEATDTQVGTVPDNTTEPEPEQKEPETKPTDNKPEEKEPEQKPVEKEPEKEPVENKPVEKEPEQTPIKVPVGMPKSYTEFSLTKNMSASEAYEYLNNFLGSKYSILVNKQHKVASDYVPTNLRVPSGCDYKLEDKAASALEDMLRAAKNAGYSDLVFYSGYRTYASQKNKFETRTQKYLNQGYSRSDAEKKAGEYIAPPGSSEHHTGLAADVCSSKIVNKYGYLSDEFDTTKEWRWLNDNCANYGFILRYKKSAEGITGFSYEPWHFRYIGVEHAKACTELDITYEEYYELLVTLRDSAKNA